MAKAQNTLGSKIQYYRLKKKLTQKELAEGVGVKHPNTISDIENDVFYPSYSLLYKISYVLDVSLNTLSVDYLKKHNPNIENLTPIYYELFDKINIADCNVLNSFNEILDEYDKLK